MSATGKFCEKHGGTVEQGDAYWLCDTCARTNINKCKCGAHARYFGEAMLRSISCEAECGENLVTICYDGDIRQMWNDGIRGSYEE